MKILVTGGAGYLGSVMIPKLVARGHQVRILDVGYFGMGHLQALRPNVEIIREDVRRFSSEPDFARDLIEDMDCVIHLAAISNDPSAELNPELTDTVNYRATVALAEVARRQGVKFLFSSSCSVYGEGDGLIAEDGMVSPLTAYAKSKVDSETALLEMADARWSPVILRNGTLFGYSPRMRFDLVVNIFSLQSALSNEIKIFGEGLQWRPFLHVKDCARAFVFFAEEPEHAFPLYNIAHENLRVVDLVDVFKRINPRLRATYVPVLDPDNRDYRVSTDRMRSAGFSPRIDVETGAEEMVDAIVSGVIADPESIFYRNAKWLKELSQFGDHHHSDVVRLLETLAGMRREVRV